MFPVDCRQIKETNYPQAAAVELPEMVPALIDMPVCAALMAMCILHI